MTRRELGWSCRRLLGLRCGSILARASHKRNDHLPNSKDKFDSLHKTYSAAAMTESNMNKLGITY
jgi:hypothetical protein